MASTVSFSDITPNCIFIMVTIVQNLQPITFPLTSSHDQQTSQPCSNYTSLCNPFAQHLWTTHLAFPIHLERSDTTQSSLSFALMYASIHLYLHCTVPSYCINLYNMTPIKLLIQNSFIYSFHTLPIVVFNETQIYITTSYTYSSNSSIISFFTLLLIPSE